MSRIGLDDIRAIFVASKLQDKLMADAIITRVGDAEYTAFVDFRYADGDVEIFEGRGKTPYDAMVLLSKELRRWCYGESSILDSDDYAAYSQAALVGSQGSGGNN